ncbi:MAG: cache domain-containing protein [Syntrophobacteraceae bacterium]|jgi:PAS domain S-box-containing protein
MKHTKLYCVLLLLGLLSALLLYSAYTEVRQKTIDQLNNHQLTLGKAAAKGIEGFFDHLARLLNALSRVDSIVALDEHGKELMEVFYQSHAGEIISFARMDANGRIIHAFPLITNVIGTDLSGREFVQRLMKTHRPVVSDVFMSASGFESIAFHVPVFNNDVFDGSLSVLIPFDHLARRYLEDIKLAEDGYAWMISRKGVELYCPVPDHVGKSVYENCRDFPTILSMADEMVQGREGQTTYLFDRIRGETIESAKKHAVYLPVHLPDNYWSIVVATPESEVPGIIHGFRNRWLLIAGVMLITGVFCSYYLGRAFMIVKGEANRKKIEDELRAALTRAMDEKSRSESIIAGMSDGLTILDRNFKVVYQNEISKEHLGIHVDEYCYRAFHNRDHICEECPVVMCFGNGSMHKKEDVGVRGDKTIYVEIAAAPLKKATGEVIGAIEVSRDITERKRAEQALKESGQLLQSIIHGYPIPAFVIPAMRNSNQNTNMSRERAAFSMRKLTFPVSMEAEGLMCLRPQPRCSTPMETAWEPSNPSATLPSKNWRSKR